MKMKTYLATILVTIILIVGSGCISSNNKEVKSTVENGNKEVKSTTENGGKDISQQKFEEAVKPKIKANVNKDCAGTPWFVGQQKGFFEQSGIDFVDKGHLDWSQQPVALISGQTDVADAHPNTIIDLLKEGAKVKGVVASGDEPSEGHIQNEHMHWLVLENSSLKTVKDILNSSKKVKIAVGALGICSDLETDAWLRQNGISKDKVELVVMPDPQQEQSLRQGLIDIAVLHPPFYTAAEEHGGVNIITSSRPILGDAAGLSLLYFTEDFIKNNPDAVRKFIKGFKNAERWSNDNPNESGAITAKEIGLEKSTAHWYSYTGAIDDAKVQKWIDAMVEDGIIKPGEYKPSDIYTNEFADEWSVPTK
jgi:ABC-type nitrate/sulfonate/bicarbonate transport system substrate-binding protein